MSYFNQENYRIEIGKVLGLLGDGHDINGFYIKPASSITHFDQAIRVPEGKKKLGYRMTLALAVGKRIDKGRRHKLSCIMGYGAALDVFDPELLEKVKRKGLPWTMAVGSDTFCPISEFSPSKDIKDPYGLEAYLEINGKELLKGSTKDLEMEIENVLELISKRITLYPGDIVLIPIKGGDGGMVAGDSVEAGISSIGVMRHIVKDTS